jgi:hypothetical protein
MFGWNHKNGNQLSRVKNFWKLRWPGRAENENVSTHTHTHTRCITHATLYNSALEVWEHNGTWLNYFGFSCWLAAAAAAEIVRERAYANINDYRSAMFAVVITTNYFYSRPKFSSPATESLARSNMGYYIARAAAAMCDPHSRRHWIHALYADLIVSCVQRQPTTTQLHWTVSPKFTNRIYIKIHTTIGMHSGLTTVVVVVVGVVGDELWSFFGKKNFRWLKNCGNWVTPWRSTFVLY